RAIGHARRAGRVDADEVAHDRVAIGLDDDAVAAEVGDVQAADGTAVTAGPEGQSVGTSASTGAVELNEDDGIVAVGHRVNAGPGLRVPVDGHRDDHGRQGETGGAGVGADVNGLHPRAGDVEVDGVVDAERAGALGGDIRIAQVVAGVDGRDGLA